MKTPLLLIAALATSTIVYAQQNVEPLSNILARINPNKLDPSELAYIGTRCGALYNVTATYFETNGSAKDNATVKQLREQARDFMAVSLALNTNVNKMSEEAIVNQARSLSEHYFRLMSDGKRLNNNAFTPALVADMTSCRNELTSYTDLTRRYQLR